MPHPAADLLLFHAMMLMVTVDGDVAPEELNLVEVFCKTVPELRDTSFEELSNRWREFCEQYQDSWEALAALSTMDDEGLRQKTFVLAADLALSSEGILPEEYEMLNNMAAALGLRDSFALNVINVLSLKYSDSGAR